MFVRGPLGAGQRTEPIADLRAVCVFLALVVVASACSSGSSKDPSSASSCEQLADVEIALTQSFFDDAAEAADSEEKQFELLTGFFVGLEGLETRQAELGCSEATLDLLLCERLGRLDAQGPDAEEIVNDFASNCPVESEVDTPADDTGRVAFQAATSTPDVTVRRVPADETPDLPEWAIEAPDVYDFSAAEPPRQPVELMIPLPEADIAVLGHFSDNGWEAVPFRIEGGMAIAEVSELSLVGFLVTSLRRIEEWFADHPVIDWIFGGGTQANKSPCDRPDLSTATEIGGDPGTISACVQQTPSREFLVRNDRRFFLDIYSANELVMTRGGLPLSCCGGAIAWPDRTLGWSDATQESGSVVIQARFNGNAAGYQIANFIWEPLTVWAGLDTSAASVYIEAFKKLVSALSALEDFAALTIEIMSDDPDYAVVFRDLLELLRDPDFLRDFAESALGQGVLSDIGIHMTTSKLRAMLLLPTIAGQLRAAADLYVSVLAGGAEAWVQFTLPTAAADPRLQMRRIPDRGSALGGDEYQGMSSVTAWEGGLVAVGNSGSAVSSSGNAAVWTSIDSESWRRVPHDESVFGGGSVHGWMFDVTVWEGGLVAVGLEGDGEQGYVVVWTSDDGEDWRRVPHDESVFRSDGGHTFEMNAVTAWDGGLVAVGRDWRSAAVWSSDDGEHWQRVPHDESVFGGEGSVQAMSDVTVWEGGLVAVGLEGDGEHYTSAAVWTSVDGEHWVRVPHDEFVFGGDFGGWMTDVTAWEGGVVAVGQVFGDNNKLATVWTSVDGEHWVRVPHDEFVFGGDFEYDDRAYEVRLTDVTAWEGGLVAVGFEGSSGSNPDGDAAVWASVDGEHWQRVPHDESVFGGEGFRFMADVTAWDGGLVAVGEGYTGWIEHRYAVVWVGRRKD